MKPWLVAGMDLQPWKVGTVGEKIAKRSKVKSFVTVYAYSHLMPTGHSVDIPHGQDLVNKATMMFLETQL